MREKKAHLFPIADAWGHEPYPGWDWQGTTGVFRGANPPMGAVIDLWIKEYTGDGVSISVVRDTAKYIGLAVANLVGTVFLKAARSPFDEMMPTLSPDGRYLAWNTENADGPELTGEAQR